MNQHQKAKRFGADAERTVVRILQRVWPDAVRRGAGMPTKERHGKDIDGVPGHFIQVKARSRSWIWSEFMKVKEAAGLERPLLVVKVKGAPPLAVLTLDSYVTTQEALRDLAMERQSLTPGTALYDLRHGDEQH